MASSQGGFFKSKAELIRDFLLKDEFKAELQACFNLIHYETAEAIPAGKFKVEYSKDDFFSMSPESLVHEMINDDYSIMTIINCVCILAAGPDCIAEIIEFDCENVNEDDRAYSDNPLIIWAVLIGCLGAVLIRGSAKSFNDSLKEGKFKNNAKYRLEESYMAALLPDQDLDKLISQYEDFFVIPPTVALKLAVETFLPACAVTLRAEKSHSGTRFNKILHHEVTVNYLYQHDKRLEYLSKMFQESGIYPEYHNASIHGNVNAPIMRTVIGSILKDIYTKQNKDETVERAIMHVLIDSAPLTQRQDMAKMEVVELIATELGYYEGTIHLKKLIPKPQAVNRKDYDDYSLDVNHVPRKMIKKKKKKKQNPYAMHI